MLVNKLINLMLMNEVEADGAAGGSAAPVVDTGSEDLSPDAQVFEALADEFENEDEESLEAASTEVPVVPAAPAATQPVVPTPTVATPAPAVQQAPSRDQAVASIAQQLAITNEDDIMQLRTEPEKVIPKLLANLFYDIHGTLTRQFQESLPNMLQSVSQRAQADLQAEQAFYEQWPALKEHNKLVLDTAKLYMKMNPTADKTVAMQEIGAMAMLKAKIPFDTVTGKPIVASAAPVNQPFRPTSTGGAGANTNASNQSPWEKMLEEFEQEDNAE